jgi:hypothetical protein
LEKGNPIKKDILNVKGNINMKTTIKADASQVGVCKNKIKLKKS